MYIFYESSHDLMCTCVDLPYIYHYHAEKEI